MRQLHHCICCITTSVASLHLLQHYICRLLNHCIATSVAITLHLLHHCICCITTSVASLHLLQHYICRLLNHCIATSVAITLHLLHHCICCITTSVASLHHLHPLLHGYALRDDWSGLPRRPPTAHYADALAARAAAAARAAREHDQ